MVVDAPEFQLSDENQLFADSAPASNVRTRPVLSSTNSLPDTWTLSGCLAKGFLFSEFLTEILSKTAKDPPES